jgi:hypothetical protein
MGQVSPVAGDERARQSRRGYVQENTRCATIRDQLFWTNCRLNVKKPPGSLELTVRTAKANRDGAALLAAQDTGSTRSHRTVIGV